MPVVCSPHSLGKEHLGRYREACAPHTLPEGCVSEVSKGGVFGVHFCDSGVHIRVTVSVADSSVVRDEIVCGCASGGRPQTESMEQGWPQSESMEQGSFWQTQHVGGAASASDLLGDGTMPVSHQHSAAIPTSHHQSHHHQSALPALLAPLPASWNASFRQPSAVTPQGERPLRFVDVGRAPLPEKAAHPSL